MRQGWGERELDLPPHPVTPWAAARRERLAGLFPGERLVVPAGTFKVRANDTDYRFRPETAHTYLSGNQTTDAVLVVEGGEWTLFARPRSSRDTDEFFRDRQYGELWAGRRPSLREIEGALGLPCRHIDDLSDVLGAPAKTRVLRGVEDDKAYHAGMNNTTTAYDLMLIFRELHTLPGADKMMGILAAQELNRGIPAGLPAGTRVAHKTGSITKIAHDAGIVDDAYVLVVLTRGFEKHDQAQKVIASISRAIHERRKSDGSAR